MMQPASQGSQGFQGLRVAAFESRLAEGMRQLIVRHGGTPVIAPALREIPLKEHHEAFVFAERLFGGQVDLLICLTGVGTRTLAAAIGTRYPQTQLRDALNRITVIARGPKPVKALTDLGVQGFLMVPEPNTWHEILALIDARVPVSGKRVTVQEYGVSNEALLEALKIRGAEVARVPVYQWALPDDLGPLREALSAMADAKVDVALFTNAAQVEHVHQVAAQGQLAERVSLAFQRMMVCSIGPIASEALRRHAYPVDLEPSHPKMGILVAEAASHAAEILTRKRVK